MAASLSEDLKDRARTLYVAGQAPGQIAKELNIRLDTVCKWSKRFKWRQTKDLATENMSKVYGSACPADLNNLSTRIRFRFANVIHRQLATLEDSDLEDITELANTPKRQGLAALAKSIYDMAEGVFGWGDEKQSGMILLTDVRQFEVTAGQTQEAIVVSEANQVTDTPQPVDVATEAETTRPESPMNTGVK